MTTAYVKWCSREKLSCAFTPSKDVIICLQDSALVYQSNPDCAVLVTTINAQVCRAYTLSDVCAAQNWNYTFSYDIAQLADPTAPLITADITGVLCVDCLTDWVRQQIGCALSSGSSTSVCDETTYLNTPSVELVDCGDCGKTISAFLRLAGGNNSLTVKSDGLFFSLTPTTDGILQLGDSTHRYSVIWLSSEAVIGNPSGIYTEYKPDGASFTGTEFDIYSQNVGAATVKIGSGGSNGSQVQLHAGAANPMVIVANQVMRPNADNFVDLGDTTHRYKIGWFYAEVAIGDGSNTAEYAKDHISTSLAGFDIYCNPASSNEIKLGRYGLAGSKVTIWAGDGATGVEQLRIIQNCLFQSPNSANESTGAGTASLSTNCPAVTPGAPFKWLKVLTSDGSTGYIPVWK